ncbi:MAG TPA: hypothetical protein VKB69_06455, partial [Micromonosporaceae bacterium]|nr:hypothetical protein [Micromonosporaceae bacterium]
AAANGGAPAPDTPTDTAPTLGDRADSPSTQLTAPDEPSAAPVDTTPGPAMPVVQAPAGGSPTVARIADTAAPADMPTRPATVPAPRRIGLGEPIVGPRSTGPSVQRLPLATPPAADPADGATHAEAPLLGARSGIDGPGSTTGPDAVTSPADAAVAAPLPVLAPDTVARYPTLAAPLATQAPATARPVVARLVGDAPPLVAGSATAGAGPVDAGGAYPGAPGAPGPAPAPTGGGNGLPAVPISRFVDPAVAPPRPAPMAPMVYATGATTPAPTAQRSTGAPSGPTIASLPLATASWVHPEIVQRIETVREVPVPQVVTVQREDAGDSGGSTSASPGETTPPASAPAAGGGTDAESMLAKLFDPILAKIKTELRLDRERRGALTDLWH